MVWRNDDISFETNLQQFIQVHDLFEKYQVKHTISVITKGIERNFELIAYIRSHPLIDPQIHCYEHKDYSLMTAAELDKQFWYAIKNFAESGFDMPTVIFPPWNKSSPTVERVAKDYGLTVSNKKVSLSYYVKNGGNVGESVVNFHSWDSEVKDLEAALMIYTSKK